MDAIAIRVTFSTFFTKGVGGTTSLGESLNALGIYFLFLLFGILFLFIVILFWNGLFGDKPGNDINGKGYNYGIKCKGQNAVHPGQPPNSSRGNLYIGNLEGHADYK